MGVPEITVAEVSSCLGASQLLNHHAYHTAGKPEHGCEGITVGKWESKKRAWDHNVFRVLLLHDMRVA